MRAAVLTEPQRIEVRELKSPELLNSNDVLIDMIAVGLCGTDIGFWTGHRRPPSYPWILGHEGVGKVSAVSTQLTTVQPGDVVTIEPNYPCSQCKMCAIGNTSLCTQRVSVGLNAPGLLSEHVVVPQQYVWPVPSGISLQAAVCTEPLAVVMTGVRRAGQTLGTGPALVVGAGAQGQLLVEVLRSEGVETAVVEPQQARREYAYQLGARAPLENELFQTVFETSGNGHGSSTAMHSLAPNGVGVLIGVGDEPLVVDTKTMVRRGLTVTGSMIYDHPGDFKATIQAMTQHRIRPDKVLGQPYVLDDAHQALDAAATQDRKTWIIVNSLSDELNEKHA